MTSGIKKGLHIDPRNPTGNRTPDELAGISFVRINVVLNGSIQPSYYRDLFASFLAKGITPIALFTHQSGAEGKFPFQNQSVGMTPAHWAAYTAILVDAAQQTVKDDRIYVQVGNEPDGNGYAAIVMPPAPYGILFRAFRQTFPRNKLMTAGYNSGSGKAIPQILAANIAHLADLICNHPYGQGAGGPNDSLNNKFGSTMRQEIGAWVNAFPSRKIFVTEFGIDHQTGLSDAIIFDYIQACHRVFAQYRIAGCVLYGASDAMDNHRGPWRADGSIRPAVRAELNTVGGTTPTPTPPPPVQPPVVIPPSTDGLFPVTVSGVLNIRAAPTTASAVIGDLRTGDFARLTGQVRSKRHDGRFTWATLRKAGGLDGWIALDATNTDIE